MYNFFFFETTNTALRKIHRNSLKKNHVSLDLAEDYDKLQGIRYDTIFEQDGIDRIFTPKS